METIHIGIIGHGFMGHEHEAMLTKLQGFELTAFTDRDPAQLADVAEGIQRYATVEELLSDPVIDVVLIAANNNQHLELVTKAARAGKDIICEKPAAMSVAEFDEMMKIVRECGVKFTVHHQRRFDPDFRTMKEVYDQGSLGEIYTVKSQLYGFNGNMHDWHVYLSEGGGMHGTYYLKDQKNWFERHWFMGGNKGSAYADGFSPTGKIVRTAGLLQNVSGHRTMTAAGLTRSFGNPREGLIITEELPEVHTCHQNYFENYYRAYRREEEFLVKPKQVRRVLSLMEAVRESAKTGKAVEFE